MSFPATPMGKNRSHWLFYIALIAAGIYGIWLWCFLFKHLSPAWRIAQCIVTVAVLSVAVIEVTAWLDGIERADNREDYALCLQRNAETGAAHALCESQRP